MPVAKTKLTAETKAQLHGYFADMPFKTRKRLREMRALILAAVPGGVDGFSYRIPCVKVGGKILVWYAGFTSHTSLYPMTEKIRRAHAEALDGYETSKGTVRFPLDRKLPSMLVKQLVKARLAEMRK